MTVATRDIHLQTRGNADVIDISDHARSVVRETGLQEGIITIFCQSSTSALTTIEFEPGAVSDLKRLFDEIIPPNRHYEHNAAWGDGNGHSHVRAALLGSSLTVPFSGGQLALGTWQQIIFVDFDNRPRRRQLVAQVIGE
jgi:secondary thiamine-phosphate synthase enzyme